MYWRISQGCRIGSVAVTPFARVPYQILSCRRLALVGARLIDDMQDAAWHSFEHFSAHTDTGPRLGRA
jgi:hypothetical protein